MAGMSPELETLDHLLGGDMPLRLVRGLFPDATSFSNGMMGLLSNSDVRLVSSGGEIIPDWRWRDILTTDVPAEYFDSVSVQITEAGCCKVS
jgi:hypothetical protein